MNSHWQEFFAEALRLSEVAKQRESDALQMNDTGNTNAVQCQSGSSQGEKAECEPQNDRKE